LWSKNDVAKLWLPNQFFIRASIENKVIDENGGKRDQLLKESKVKTDFF